MGYETQNKSMGLGIAICIAVPFLSVLSKSLMAYFSKDNSHVIIDHPATTGPTISIALPPTKTIKVVPTSPLLSLPAVAAVSATFILLIVVSHLFWIWCFAQPTAMKSALHPSGTGTLLCGSLSANSNGDKVILDERKEDDYLAEMDNQYSDKEEEADKFSSDGGDPSDFGNEVDNDRLGNGSTPDHPMPSDDPPPPDPPSDTYTKPDDNEQPISNRWLIFVFILFTFAVCEFLTYGYCCFFRIKVYQLDSFSIQVSNQKLPSCAEHPITQALVRTTALASLTAASVIIFLITHVDADKVVRAVMIDNASPWKVMVLLGVISVMLVYICWLGKELYNGGEVDLLILVVFNPLLTVSFFLRL
jgi:hypothetical protein